MCARAIYCLNMSEWPCVSMLEVLACVRRCHVTAVSRGSCCVCCVVGTNHPGTSEKPRDTHQWRQQLIPNTEHRTWWLRLTQLVQVLSAHIDQRLTNTNRKKSETNSFNSNILNSLNPLMKPPTALESKTSQLLPLVWRSMWFHSDYKWIFISSSTTTCC